VAHEGPKPSVDHETSAAVVAAPTSSAPTTAAPDSDPSASPDLSPVASAPNAAPKDDHNTALLIGLPVGLVAAALAGTALAGTAFTVNRRIRKGTLK
jgi:hypothetical protein